MKVTIEIDATPKEMRVLMGMPDVEPLQQEMLDKMREKIMAGVDSSNPMEMMKLLMPTADQFKSMNSLQASFWQAFTKGSSGSENSESDK